MQSFIKLKIQAASLLYQFFQNTLIMKTHFYVALLAILFMNSTYSQSNQVEVDGHLKIEGRIDLSHMEDSTTVIIGKESGLNSSFVTQRFNTFVGSFSGNANASGSENSFFGYGAGKHNIIGEKNTYVGYNSGLNNTNGSFNAFFGHSAGLNTNGDNLIGVANTFIGTLAGVNNTSGYANTYIGYNAGGLNTDLYDAIAIGANAKVGCSKCAVIGYGNDFKLGINTANPVSMLDVRGTVRAGIPGENNTLLTFNVERSWSFVQEGSGSTTSLALKSIGGGGNKNFLINTSGFVGIGDFIGAGSSPDAPLDMISGAHVTIGGVWTNASSRALKENINELSLEEAITTINMLTPVKFNYKRQKGEEYVGFIAEDVPDLVATQDRKSLSAMDIVSVLTKVVQDQDRKIKVLNRRVSNMAELEKEIDELKNQLRKLMTQMDEK
jgi:hypothetical protein